MINITALGTICLCLAPVLYVCVAIIISVPSLFDDSREKMVLGKWYDAIYETGLIYDYDFVMTADIPDMPGGALFIFDADGFGKHVTEYYLQPIDDDAMRRMRTYRGAPVKSIFIDEARRTIVMSGYFGFYQDI